MATGEAPGTIGDFLAFLQPSSNAVELEIREPIDAWISDVPGIPRLPGIPISEVKWGLQSSKTLRFYWV